MKKIVLAVIFILLIVYMTGATMVIAPYYNTDSDENIKNTISREVDSERYQEETYIVTDKLKIEKNGRYVIEANWDCDTELVTGYVLLSPDGERMGYCTGTSVKMSTYPIELRTGTYDMSFYHMFNETHEVAFEEKTGDEMSFVFTEVKGISHVNGEYTLKMVGPALVWEVVYLVSMIVALMGSVLIFFELLQACVNKQN